MKNCVVILLVVCLLLLIEAYAGDEMDLSGNLRKNRRLNKNNRRRPSRPPVTPREDSPSPSPTASCRIYADSTSCKADTNCDWIRFRVNGKNFIYGCYSNVPGSFCDFRGTPNEIQQQCSQNGGWCAYNYFSQTCKASTPAPTVTWECHNGCFKANDGVCDDGAAGSSTYYCIRGSDCNDCGPREKINRPAPVG